MLIIFGGLPGVGKTTLARKLAQKLEAVYLRIDSLEQALVRSGIIKMDEVGPAGYFAGYAIVADNLRLGLTVVADSVNPLQITRDAWRDVAIKAGVAFLEIEVICSDADEHRRRVEHRTSDIPDLVLPDWQCVMDRTYDRWDREHMILDTATILADQAVEIILEAILKR